MDNLELIKEILSLDPKALKVIMEMLKKNKNNRDGYIMVKYKKGMITVIKSEKVIE